MQKKKLLFLAILFISVLSVSTVKSLAQDLATRIIDKLSYDSEPIRVTDIKIKGTAMQFGESVLGNEDWLEGLEFNVENVSSKSIQYMDIGITVRITKDHYANIPLRYGQYPNNGMESQLIPTNGKFKVSLPTGAYSAIRKHVENLTKSSVKKVVIEVNHVYFNNTEGWYLGYKLHPDRDEKGAWVREELMSNTCPKPYLESNKLFHRVSFKPDGPCDFCRGSFRRSRLITCCSSNDGFCFQSMSEDYLKSDFGGCERLVRMDELCFCNLDRLCSYNRVKSCLGIDEQ
jgi:hypothetical protein